MGDLRGRRILVTGASRGIGLAVARELARGGAAVGMASRRAGMLAERAEEIGAHPFPADVTAGADVDRLVREVDAWSGGSLDALVNSAGAFALAPFGETSPEDLRHQLDVNVLGPFQVARAFLPGMLRRGTGHIVNIGSIAGRVPLPGNAAYAASKFGLRGLHEVLALELAGSGVKATLVEPAATDTPLWDDLDPDSRDDLPSRARMLRPDDVARSVRFALDQPPGVEISYLALRAAS